MSNKPEEPQSIESVSSEIYDEEYYLAHCDGYISFGEFAGEKLPARLETAWFFSDIKTGMRVLDIGVGRGETFYRSHKIGAEIIGIDFSSASIKIAQSVICNQNLSGLVTQADAKSIPFKDGSFDRILMFDIVEHLYPWELQKTYKEAWRLLKPGGKLIIHTTPNIWYYQFGYPIYRLLERLRGQRLPTNPRDRFKFHNQVHVNEQSIWTLRQEVSSCGFQVRTRLVDIPKESQQLPFYITLVLPILHNVPPFLWVFRNDLFAVATKRC